MPAVAVRHERLVLFIFNRFKGYLDGISSQKRYGFTRVLCEKVSILGVEMKFFNTLRTDNGESNLLCNN